MKLSDVKGTKKVAEGYTILPPMNTDKYGERKGLEGPFRTRSGKVVYYDPREGMYYDPDTDIYLTYDEWKKLDEGSNDILDAEAMLHKLAQEYQGTLAGMGHRDENEIIADMERIADPLGLDLEDYLDEDMYETKIKTRGSAADYTAQMDQAHSHIYPGKQKPRARLSKAIAAAERERKRKPKESTVVEATGKDATYIATDGTQYFKLVYPKGPGSNPQALRHQLNQKAKSLGISNYKVVAYWAGDIDKELAAAQDKLASGKKWIPSVQKELESKVKNMTKAKKIMSQNKILEDGMTTEARSPMDVINKFLAQKKDRETHGQELRKERDAEEVNKRPQGK